MMDSNGLSHPHRCRASNRGKQAAAAPSWSRRALRLAMFIGLLILGGAVRAQAQAVAALCNCAGTEVIQGRDGRLYGVAQSGAGGIPQIFAVNRSEEHTSE